MTAKKLPTLAIEAHILMDKALVPFSKSKPILGAKKVLESLEGKYFLLIHTFFVSDDRGSIEYSVRELESWLRSWGLKWDGVWTRQGKPYAHEYIESFERLSELAKDCETVPEVQELESSKAG